MKWDPAREMQKYLDASGGTSAVRSIKSQMYGVGKHSTERADRTDSAQALPVRDGTVAENARLVPQNSQGQALTERPINNMGENLVSADEDDVVERWSAVSEEHLGEVSLVMTESGKTKTVMVRRPAVGQVCIIDWINFTVLEDTFFKTARQTLVADEQIIEEASRQFEMLFGFGITEKCASGKNWYRDSWVLGDKMGFVCFGNQRSTMMVMLSGQGCQNALAGWEKRLHDFLTNVAIRPSISRIDLAHDDFGGDFLSVDWAEKQWWDGGYSFKKGGRPPEIQEVGNWKRPSGKGRTLTIGQRQSSKYCRFYEKGKHEGDKASLWCRCEVEFKNTSMIILPEVLLNPSQWFCGAYPCFEAFAKSDTPRRFEVKQKTAQITVAACIEVTKHQFGKYLRVFRELYGDREALDLVCNDSKDYWPKRMKPLTNSATSGPTPVHKLPPQMPTFLQFITTVPSYGLNGENGFT